MSMEAGRCQLPGARVIDGCKLSEQGVGDPVQEQQVVLTADPSL